MNMIKKLLALALSFCLVFGLVGGVSATSEYDSELNEMLTTFQEMVTKYGPHIADEVRKGTAQGTRLVYTVKDSSYYVAIGDASVRETATYTTYASMLAADLDIEYKNLGVKDLLMADVVAEVINLNKEELEKADLVTLGFSFNGFASVALNEVLRDEGEASAIAWEKYLNAEGIAEVKAAVADLEKYLKDNGVDGTYNILGKKMGIAKALTIASETFAYGTLAYAVNLPKAIDAIQAINPNVKIVIVGMDNPLDGSSVKLSNGEVMDLGGYVDQLIAFTSEIGQTVALEDPNTAFVSAPDASSANDGREMTTTDLVVSYMPQNLAKALPDAEGQAYIAGQIDKAFMVLGDADMDGEAGYTDALLALRASVGLVTLDYNAALCADVDFDGEVGYTDALKILRASVGLETLG